MAWGVRSGLKEADSPVFRAHPEAGDLIYAEGLLVGYRGYDRSGTEPLICFGHGPGYTDWTYELLAPVPQVIIAGQDLPLVVTVRNSGERAGREVVQVYLERPDDNPSRPLARPLRPGIVPAGLESWDLQAACRSVFAGPQSEHPGGAAMR